MIVETVSNEAATVHACSTGTWTYELVGTREETEIAESNLMMHRLLEHDLSRTAAQGSPGQPVVQPTGEHSQRLFGPQDQHGKRCSTALLRRL